MDGPKPINPASPKPLDYRAPRGQGSNAPIPALTPYKYDYRPSRLKWILASLALLAIAGLTTIAIEIPRHSLAQRSVCEANLRAIATACDTYSAAHNGQLPANFEDLLLVPRVKSDIFVCPGSTDTPAQGTLDEQAAALAAGGHSSYIWLGGTAPPLASPDVVLAYEPLSNHANTGIHVLFFDYRVEWLGQPDAQKLIDSIMPGEPAVWPPTSKP